MKLLYSLGTLFFTGLLLAAFPAEAVTSETILRQDAVSRGYTVSDASGQFKLGLAPQSVNQPVKVVVNTITNVDSLPVNTLAVSETYEYSITSQTESNLILAQPLAVSLAFTSTNFFPKKLLYWDTALTTWQPLATSIDWVYKTARAKTSSLNLRLVVAEELPLLHDNYQRTINQETLNKGFTVALSDEAFAVGLPPKALTRSATVKLSQQAVDMNEVPKGLTPASGVFTYEVTASQTVILGRPLFLSLRFTIANFFEKKIYQWSAAKKSWEALTSIIDWDKKQVRTTLKESTATLAIFENPAVVSAQEGIVSWYRSRKTMSAANNLFPVGSKLKVTNLENGKSVVVKVVSRGPFVPNRVIDITLDAFRLISQRSEGIANVRVEAL